MQVLQCHKQGKIRQPIPVFCTESSKCAIRFKPFPGKAQHLQPAVVQQAKVYFILPAVPLDSFQLLPLQKALFHQHFQTDQIMITRKGGAGLVG